MKEKSLLFQDFDERTIEVSKYLMLIKNLEQETIKLSMGVNNKQKIRKSDSDLEKTLKATSFLLLYNLTESTMRNAIEIIFDELSKEGISFDKIRNEIKIIIIKNIQNNHSPKNLLNKINTIAVDIISASFDKEKLFSGNLDAKKIRKTAEIYGFSCKTDSRQTEDGIDLITIKTHRNNLAHGLSSFKEVGKDVSADELLAIKKKVVCYLRQILQNIETYLANKEYLDSS
ncbi:MAG: hypothetical protein F6J89_18745 [Symploca sp. SIO1C4]|uniref:MAE-28990/MAE-18760-like HEPN domain-containing protein n=1 Tax=Symploca sp. SIO1C4 TaxID=2607765 RepID=A0A6B3N920_9CYAN|nr:hypothetical protein [Symploca sp. SIO1C4]